MKLKNNLQNFSMKELARVHDLLGLGKEYPIQSMNVKEIIFYTSLKKMKRKF